jgi:hypothetical protein
MFLLGNSRTAGIGLSDEQCSGVYAAEMRGDDIRGVFAKFKWRNSSVLADTDVDEPVNISALVQLAHENNLAPLHSHIASELSCQINKNSSQTPGLLKAPIFSSLLNLKTFKILIYAYSRSNQPHILSQNSVFRSKNRPTRYRFSCSFDYFEDRFF